MASPESLIRRRLPVKPGVHGDFVAVNRGAGQRHDSLPVNDDGNRIMEWIKELDEYGYNILIDELVFHLENGKKVISITKVQESKKGFGYDFKFKDGTTSFLNVFPELIENTWKEASEIRLKFTQLANLKLISS